MAHGPYELFKADNFSNVRTSEYMHTSPFQCIPRHLPGMIMLEKPSFRVMDTP